MEGCLFSCYHLRKVLIKLPVVLWAVLDTSGRDRGLRTLLSKLDCPTQTYGQIAERKDRISSTD